jgi:hypothetical protein
MLTTLFHAAEGTQWTLTTEDTTVRVMVNDNKLSMAGLTSGGQGWQWVPTPSEVPMPGRDSLKVASKMTTPNWTFRGAAESKTNGHLLVLRFTSTEPALELKSYWQALPGPGPVENWVTIENQSAGPVEYHVVGMPAARLSLKAESPVKVHRAAKIAAGTGQVEFTPLEANGKVATGTGHLPFVLLDVGARHGLYLGFEWELGGFQIGAGADARDITASVHPLTHVVGRASKELFEIPSVYYGVYRGDIDDGANRFKRWFWNHKITRSLHDNKDEPWVEVCMQELGGNGSSGVTGKTPQSSYDRLAATGAECVKMDFWDGTGQCWYTDRDWQFKPAVWPDGFDFAKKARKAGLKASLYMGSTYLDGDLNTTEARDRQLAALLKRYDEGWFDMWRTDRYTAPHDPMPSTYQGILNFQYIIDHLIANRPGFRYENCANGGKFKGFNICRRMTFMTMNDKDQTPWLTRSTYYSDTFAINPVQLKSDLGPATHPYYLRTDMLGAILTWAADNPVYREHIALYKTRQRPILRGANVYHILPMPDGKNWDGLQFHNPDLDRGSVFVFKPSDAVPESQYIKLRGLLRDKVYRVQFQDAKERSGTMTGAQLMDEGLTITLKGKEASEIIWLNCPELSATPQSVLFAEPDNVAVPAPQRVTITYQHGPDTGKAFAVTAADPWLTVETVSGSGDGQVLSVSVVPGPQPQQPGVYRSSLILTRPGQHDRLVVPVEWRHAMTKYACWSFDEPEGEVAKDSWGKHPGKLVGGPTRVPGKRGTALRFNGKGQHVQTDTILDDLKIPCAFAFWVNPDAVQGAHADIFGNHRGSTHGLVMQQEGSAVNKFSFGYGSTPAPGGAGPVQLTAGAWQHVAIVCDGKEVVVYLGGKEAARGTGIAPLTPNPQLGFQLGNGYAEGRFFAGALDDFRIYGRALSAAEIAAIITE